jgi:hypothetical protein
MQIRKSFALAFAFAAALWLVSVGGARQASAQVVDQLDIIASGEFPGVCEGGPCYSVEVHTVVYTDADVGVLGVCAAGDYTYTYTLEHLGGTFPSPNVAVDDFRVHSVSGPGVSAGFIAGAGIDPTSSTVAPTNVAVWVFPDDPACSTSPCLNEGQTSDTLYICVPAPSTPAIGPASLKAAGLTVNDELIGPTQPPVDGEPVPCTIGFWKNHQDQPPYDSLAEPAAALSGGVFANGAELLAALNRTGGGLTMAEKAERQLAATLLDLAADNLDPETTKCSLADSAQIDDNSCGTAPLSVGTAVSQSIVNLQSGIHDQVEWTRSTTGSV